MNVLGSPRKTVNVKGWIHIATLCVYPVCLVILWQCLGNLCGQLQTLIPADKLPPTSPLVYPLFLSAFSGISCIQRKKHCKRKSLMLITFFQCCESISRTSRYYLSSSFALLCGGNEASERRCSGFGDLYTQAGFQICCAVWGLEEVNQLWWSAHTCSQYKHICSFSG